MAVPKVSVTKNYRLFTVSDSNREMDVQKHKRLIASMKQYGFLPCFPIACHRNGDKHLVVDDGQHRLAVAETLGLPVYWMEVEQSFDVATINSTAVVWKPRDYAECYAKQGKQAYQKLLEFCDSHHVPITMGACMLAGTVSFGNVSQNFYNGTFAVNDPKFASVVAAVFSAAIRLTRRVGNSRFLAAIMACVRAKDFDLKRMLECIEKLPDRLLSYSTRDAYLDALEAMYNHGRQNHIPLKFQATEAMRARNAAPRPSGHK